MAQNKMIRDMTVGSTTPMLLSFAFPIMLSNLLQTAYSMVDMVIVGQAAGSAGLSAVSVGAELMGFFTFIGMGFSTAGQIMISQYIGAGRHKELNRVIGSLFSFIVASGLVMMIISLSFAGSFLNWLHVPEEAFDGALSYVICCSVGLTFIFGYNTVSAILRGMGDSRHPMIFIGIAAVLNVVLDAAFIMGLGMGAFGAALATVTAQGLSFLLSIMYLYRNRVSFGFDFKAKSFIPHKAELKTILKLGLPIALQSCAGNISGLFVSSYINSFGVVASAVTGVGNKLNSAALIVANSLNVSSSAMIGQSFGAGKTERIRGIFFRVFAFDLIFVSILSAVILLFPAQIFGIFNSDPDVLSMAALYAPVAAVSFMGFAVRSPSLGFINGLGQSQINFAMGIAEGIILRIGLTYLLGVVLDLGIMGFWYGSVIASYGYGLVVFPYFFSGVWKKKRLAVADSE